VDAPAALQHQLATAQTGDTFDISSFCYQVPGFTKVNVARTWSGGTLVFSDSPEYVPGPGVLYADTLPVGPARFFVYHVNDSAKSGTKKQSLKFSIIVEPAAAGQTPVLTINRKSIQGPSADYGAVGVHGAFDLLSMPATPATRTITGPTILDSALESTIVPAQSYPSLVQAQYDLVVSGAPLKFTIAAFGRNDDSISTYSSLQRLTRTQTTPGVYDNDRGTFPGTLDKAVTMLSGYYSTASGMMHIRAGGGAADQYGADAWAGEGNPAGYDAILGVPSTLRGNFGVVYRFTIQAHNPDGRRVAVLMNPWGGAVTGVTTVGPSLTGPGTYYSPAGGAWIDPITKATLIGCWDPAVTPEITFAWTPPGSTSLPVEFVLVPYPEPGDVNADGVLDLRDAVMTMRFVSGLATPTVKQAVAADVMPSAKPDGAYTLDDVVWILKRSSGLS
jgi:hypothetical protein